jgi:hypothetical protein
LNDIIAGRLVLDLRTGRVVRPPKQKKMTTRPGPDWVD